MGMDTSVDQTAILNESLKCHDIIQKDFIDTYRNLTIKTIMGMEWVATYCPNASYVMKTDSDMFVNIGRLFSLLQPDQPHKNNFFTGHFIGGVPHRNKDSKWYMPPSLYPDAKYPDFCSGTGYVFSADVVLKIYRSSFKVNFLYLEDVFVGLCLRRERIAITRDQRNLFNNYLVPFTPCTYRNLITSHGLTATQKIEYWIRVKKYEGAC
ncbi:beta-1,3-galactosyltransferase 2-like [Discoglossus pictus]